MMDGPSALKPAAAKGGYDIMSAPLSQVGMNELFPMLKALEKEGADEEFVNWVKKPGNAKTLMVAYRFQLSGDIRSFEADLVTVPDLSAAELIEYVQRTLGTSRAIWQYERWKYVAGERGKTFEAKTWTPHREVSSVAVREHFAPDGFAGSIPAFLVWLVKHNPLGHHMSIPNNTRLFGGRVPDYFREKSGRCMLHLDRGYGKHLTDYWTFVAFREVK